MRSQYWLSLLDLEGSGRKIYFFVHVNLLNPEDYDLVAVLQIIVAHQDLLSAFVWFSHLPMLIVQHAISTTTYFLSTSTLIILLLLLRGFMYRYAKPVSSTINRRE